MKNFLFICIILISSSTIFALPGDLDTDFGVSGGYVVSDFEFTQRDERHRDSVIQADGKIIVVGKRFQATIGFDEYLVARYNADGTLDTTFSGDGFFTLFDNSQFESANAVAIQPDGKIIVVGGEGSSSTEAFIFRLNSDGTLDTTFSGDGIQVITNSGTALSVVIQPSDSKIVIGTSSIGNNLPTINQTVVLRLNTDGSLDPTFDGDGRVFVNPNIFFPNGLVLQTDGKIVVAGQSSASSTLHDVSLIRLNANGTFDASFGGDGVVQTVLANQESEARCVVIQSNGKIVIGGSSTQPMTSNSDPTLIRYNSNGSLDTSFDDDGVRIVELLNNNQDNHFYDIIQQTDGKIVGISNSDGNFGFFNRDDFFVTRFNSDGSLDSSFDTNGIAKSQWCEDGTELVLQTDGKLVAIGSQDRPTISTPNHGICVQRFDQDGAVDYGFKPIAPNGKAAFSNYGFTEVSAVAGLPNGKILVAGWGEPGTITEAMLIRLNADGTLDTSFMNEGIYLKNTLTSAQPYYFYDLKTFGDGSFFIAGGSNELGGVIIKFTAAGVPDTTFSGDGVVTSASATRFYALAIQPDGKILGCGSLGTGGTRSGRIVRFSAGGTQEASAVNNMGASVNNNEILECGLQTDGKIVVSGYGFDGLSDSVRASRHLTTLTIDTTFGTSGVTTTDMSLTLNDRATDMVVQSDDKIVVSSTGLNMGGDRDFALIRYDSNGFLDQNFTENFGTGGISLIDFVLGNPNDEANALLIQPDGQMIVGGSSNPGTGERFSLAKLNADGSLAFGFGTLGRTSTLFPNNDSRINALGFYLTNGIIAAGRTWNGTDYDFAIVRYQNEFIPTAANVLVSGRVLTENGNGIRNVVVTIIDTNGNVLATRTSTFGYFHFYEIRVGETYVISVNSRRFTFKPSSQVINVDKELSNIDFIAYE